MSRNFFRTPAKQTTCRCRKGCSCHQGAAMSPGGSNATRDVGGPAESHFRQDQSLHATDLGRRTLIRMVRASPHWRRSGPGVAVTKRSIVMDVCGPRIPRTESPSSMGSGPDERSCPRGPSEGRVTSRVHVSADADDLRVNRGRTDPASQAQAARPGISPLSYRSSNCPPTDDRRVTRTSRGAPQPPATQPSRHSG